MFGFFKREKREVTKDTTGWFEFFGSLGSTYMNKPENVTTAYACIRLISNTVAMTNIKHYSVTEEGKEEIASSTLTGVLRNPYHQESYFEWLRNMVQDTVTYGNGYSMIIRNDNNTVTDLVYVPEKSVSVYAIVDGKLETDRAYYQVSYKGESFPVFKEDMIHFKNIGDFGSNRGLSPVTVHRSTFDTAYKMNDYINFFLENGSGISGIIESEKPLNANTVDELRKNFANKFSGSRNAGKTPVLPQGLSYKQLKPLSPADADYINSKKLSKYDICEIYGVPPSMLGTSDLSYNNTESLAMTFQRFTIQPLLDHIDQELSIKLIPSYKRAKEVIKFVPDTLKLASNKEKAETLSLLTNTGIITPNEAREFYGFKKMDGGDELNIQTNEASPKDAELIGEGNNPSPADTKTDSNIQDQKTQTA